MDGVTFLLFVAFVVFLFLGYLGWDASVPSTGLAAAALFGSLAVLFFANWRAGQRMPEPTPLSSR